MSSTTATAIKTLSIALSLAGASGIANFSLFSIPMLQSQPAQHSLPQIRWYFSRGSHVFPNLALGATAGFAYLAYASLPAPIGALGQLVKMAVYTPPVRKYLIASALCFSIAPWTQNAMIPTNFRLMELNISKGGARSEKSAKLGDGSGAGVNRQTIDSVKGEGEADEFSDLSKPQTKTPLAFSLEEEQEVQDLLEKFKWLNCGRAVLIGAGGLVGLVTALA